MMVNVTFFLQESDDSNEPMSIDDIACHLSALHYQNKARVVVLCKDKSHAERIDELMWQLPTHRFVPHNLSGEGPTNGTPVEICWQEPRNLTGKALINLTESLPVDGSRCRSIADFVPNDDELKPLARTRYKQYREAGFQLDTKPAASIIESNHG